MVQELLTLMTAFGGLKTTFGRYFPSNALLTYDLQTPSDALPAFGAIKKTAFGGLKTTFGRGSPSNAAQAYAVCKPLATHCPPSAA